MIDNRIDNSLAVPDSAIIKPPPPTHTHTVSGGKELPIHLDSRSLPTTTDPHRVVLSTEYLKYFKKLCISSTSI